MYFGTDQVFGGRSLNELIDQLSKARPTATALSQSSAAYERIFGELDQVQTSIRAAMNQARSGHQGAAADASQDHAARQAAYATEATTDASSAGKAVTNQSQHHADTLARMPEPAEEPSMWGAVTIPLDPSHSYITKVGDYAGRQQQAVDAMNNYQGSTNSTVREFALFTEPKTSPVGLDNSGMSGNPGFPGGGGAAAGVQPAGGSAGGVSGAGAQAPSISGVGGIPVGPQGAQQPGGTSAPPRGSTSGAGPRGSTSAKPGTSGSTGTGTPGLTPLRPRAGAPGAWDAAIPGSRPGAGGAAAGAAEGSVAKGGSMAGRSGPGSGFLPMGAGAGGRRGDEERRRPSWLLEDDPEAAFGPMPPHAPPVIEASDWDPR